MSTSFSPLLLEKYNEWMTYDQNEISKKELQTLKEKGDVKDLEKRLMERMEFGTAGLRSRMGAGYSQMNDLTIIQTAQGLLRYCEACFGNMKTAGLVVGYDGRHNSSHWARITANIFLRAGYPVYLFSSMNPTPFVPFAVNFYKAACGVMVTASHNPKEDNGYKVYWSNSAQIIAPHDKGISTAISANLEPWATSWDVSFVDSNSLCRDPLKEISDAYFSRQKTRLCYNFDANSKSSLIFTYTAMHGVGWRYVQGMCETFGFKHVVPVKEQVEPDPEFPTVKFPNPEEGRSALDLSMQTADRAGSRVILANDPDADRLAVAEKQASGKWKIFTGNELGALMGWWSWVTFKKANPDLDPSNAYLLASTVSSKILRAIATKEGCKFEETLTGFKWMGNLSDQLIKAGKHVVFAFEEAIGFMCGSEVLDKDGIGALAVMGELAIELYAKGTTLQDQLEEIYKQYGYHSTNNSYYFCYDQVVIKAVFQRLRNWEAGREGPDNYPLTCGPYKISAVRDLTTGYDSNYPDKKARLPVSSSSQMMTFSFENGCVATIRTSGTEPKIKYYSEFCAKPDDKRSRTELDKELTDIVSHIVREFYEPEKNNLTPRMD